MGLSGYGHHGKENVCCYAVLCALLHVKAKSKQHSLGNSRWLQASTARACCRVALACWVNAKHASRVRKLCTAYQ
jgi:hypothetical protein